MTETTLDPRLKEGGRLVEERWRKLAATRRIYTGLTVVVFLSAFFSSLWFANDTNAGKFFNRLPHFFDFVGDMIPRDGMEVWRALFDLPSPYYDGSLRYDYPEGRHYLTQNFYLPEYFYKMLETLNIALFATLVGAIFGFMLCFVAAKNLTPNPLIRGAAKRVMEVLRAFPEVVLAGFFLAILSVGPVPAVIAVTIHTIGALGKLFYEVVENADMKPDEGLRAAGGNWVERVRFGMVPQVLPNFISYLLLRLEINVRASTIIGAVGGGGIGEQLRLSISRGHEAKTLAIVLLLFITIIAVDQFSAWLRKRLTGDEKFLAIA